MQKIQAGERYIGRGEPIFIIAEAGVNHNGHVELAKRLMDVAAKAVRQWRMNVNSVLKRLDYHYIVIVVCSLVAHGLLLLNDGIYWDGWLIYYGLVEKNWNVLSLWMNEMGRLPFAQGLLWLFMRLSDVVFGYKLAAFVAITLAGMLVYMIGNETKLINLSESLFIALLSLTYPAFQVSIEFFGTHYLLYYWLFLLACLLAIKSEKLEESFSWCLRICSLILFAVSFTLNSLFVFFFGFMLVLIGRAYKIQRISKKQVFVFVLQHLDYVLLPMLLWTVKGVFFPPHGLYSHYNQITLSLSPIIEVYTDFIKNAVYAQLDEALKILINYNHPVLGLLILLVAQWIYSTFLSSSACFSNKRANLYAFFFFGLVLLGLGIFPYAAVGKAPSVHGWRTRYALLVSLPIAIILVAAVRLSFGRSDFASYLGASLLMALVVVFGLTTIKNYISWQVRWVKDRSIMVNLSNLDNVQGFSVFWIDDRFPAGGESFYRFYEWSSIFKTQNGVGDESRIGLDQRGYSTKFLVDGQRFFGTQYGDRYNLSDFDPAGCQAVLTIRRGPKVHCDIDLSARYLFFKYFRRDKLEEFLAGVTDLQVQSIVAPQAVNCPGSYSQIGEEE